MAYQSNASHSLLKKLSIYGAIAVVLLIILWATIGYIARAYEFWDDDPDRGATTVETDIFGDRFTETRYLEQGWDEADSLWFYNTTQGSNLLPYDFFLDLEQADSEQLFRSSENLNRYRYLPQKPTYSNPDGLPVGMTRDTYKGKAYMGFTCAACHTSQVNYNGIGIRIDGGPSAADMESFMKDLASALIATKNNEDKKQRFMAAVLARGNHSTPQAVEDDLEKYARRIGAYNVINNPRSVDRPLTTYGYSRLDAFGRIFNRVLEHVLSVEQLRILLRDVVPPEQFDEVMKDIDPILTGAGRDHLLSRIEQYLTPQQQMKLRNKIFIPADAPVSYPFLWDIPQHDYVQWNGVVANSGIGPVGRNAGQVIGVFGTLDWQQKEGWTLSSVIGGQGFGNTHIDFSSSINIRNLRRVETHMRTLMSPQWPEDILPAIDSARAYRGSKLFDQYCQACHERIDRASKDRRVIATMNHIDSVKTDPKMALNSVQSIGYSGILRHQYVEAGLGDLLLQTEMPVAALLKASTKNVITTPDQDKGFIQRWAERLFDILITLFDNEVKSSLKRGDYTPNTTVNPFAALTAYKGRSLNGIWATAPYLHNGSVPTLYDLLLPQKREGDPEEGEYRPNEFMVGSREFDPVKVGFKSEGYQGFLFRTDIYGNHNSGHEYAAGRTPLPNGRLLPALDREQRLDLLEYLKTL